MGRAVLRLERHDSHLNNRNYDVAKSSVEAWTLYNHLPHTQWAYYRDLDVFKKVQESVRGTLKPPGIRMDTAGTWIADERKKRVACSKKNTINDVPVFELQNALSIYRENLSQIISTCKKQRQRMVVLNQPTIHRKDLPEQAERLTWAHRSDGAFSTAVLVP